MYVTVIIPTYNRKESLRCTLDSLSQQTLTTDRYEVIVVDDGSSDGTKAIANQQFPFSMRYLCQENQGATVARNQGAAKSQGDILVFIDDDVTVSPQALEVLAEACSQRSKVLVMGVLISHSKDVPSVYTKVILASSVESHADNGEAFIHFTECNTELLSVKRNDFFDLGMMQDPTRGRGWPNWDDVDFGYRAHLNGFRLLQSPKAIGKHWDFSLTNAATAYHRWQRASKAAVLLFHTHPGLQPYIPMLHDKTPITWGHDSPSLVAHKMARYMASSRPVLRGVEQFIAVLERYYPSPVLLRPLYRWVSGGYMFQGYREGIRSYGPVNGSK